MSRCLKPLSRRRGYHKPCRWQRRRTRYLQAKVQDQCATVVQAMAMPILSSAMRVRVWDIACTMPSYRDELLYLGFPAHVPNKVTRFLNIHFP